MQAGEQQGGGDGRTATATAMTKAPTMRLLTSASHIRESAAKSPNHFRRRAEPGRHGREAAGVERLPRP